MATNIDICNLALSLLGEGTQITSIAPPDGSPNAGNCARWYPMATRACFEAFDWSWATRRVKPARLMDLDNGVYRWLYAFSLPSDMSRLISVKASCGEHAPLRFVEYEVEANSENGSRLLLCNESEPVISYVQYVDNASLYPTYFVQCVVLRLASMLVGPLRRTDSATNVAAGLLQQFKQALSYAKTEDAKTSIKRKSRFVASQIRARNV